MVSARRYGKELSELEDAITAFDIEEGHVELTRAAVVATLQRHGVSAVLSQKMAIGWVRAGDFLLTPVERSFDFVVGNPPYIRIEQLAPELQAEYRRRYSTIFDRADLYVAFIERGLHLLSARGVLSFVCADRWILNRYGAPLRELITSKFEVRAYIDLHKASPFEADVIAYPSIFVIGRERLGKPVNVVALSKATAEECSALRRAIGGVSRSGPKISKHTTWFKNSDPWVLSSPKHRSILRSLEDRLPLLESTDASVRIGVATGNDSLYVVPSDSDIEADRLVPLVMRADLANGKIVNAHRSVINTSTDQGTIDLDKYPRLRRYFLAHEGVLKQRHVAKKNQAGWFRTIDRVYPDLIGKPKLLIPDIAGSNEVVFEPGHY